MTASAALFHLSRRWSLDAVDIRFSSLSLRNKVDVLFKHLSSRRNQSHVSALDGTLDERVDGPAVDAMRGDAIKPEVVRQSRFPSAVKRFPADSDKKAKLDVETLTRQQRQPMQTFASVYDSAKRRPENESTAPAAPIRTFKSVFEVAQKGPDSAPWAERFRALQNDFLDMHPTEKINHLKNIKLCQRLAKNPVIMRVSLRDVFFYMQPSRIVVCVLAPFPLYYTAKLAVFGFGVPALPAQLLSVGLTCMVFYRYLSSVCTEIKKDAKNSTYCALFPFRLLENRVIFRKSQVKLISTKRDIYRTCHLVIKGRKAYFPRRGFVSHTHYDELICPTSKRRNRKDSR